MKVLLSHNKMHPFLVVLNLLCAAIMPLCNGQASNYKAIPLRYHIDVLDLNTNALSQTGYIQNHVSIEIQFKNTADPIKKIYLDLNSNCTVSRVFLTMNGIRSKCLSKRFGLDQISIKLSQRNVLSGYKGLLEITHKCPLNNPYGQGMYFNVSQNYRDRIVATQFAAIEARRMFPCFDVPTYKTPFLVRVKRSVLRNGESVYSNGRQKPILLGNRFIEFEQTPALPTYLVALVIGKFNRHNSVSDNIDIGVIYSPVFSPNISAMVTKVLQKTAEHLTYMAEYTGVRYHHNKLDLAFIPMLYGGMENFGLITMNAQLQNSYLGLLSTLAHEVAHLWFGDLVTPTTWDNYWLKEGFANLLMSKQIESNVSLTKMGLAMEQNHSGSLLFPYSANHSISPIQSKDNSFGLLYTKGCAVLRMLEKLMGEINFRTVVQRYIQKFADSNADTADFLSIVDSVANEMHIESFERFSPSTFAYGWITQKGFPKVIVTENDKGEIILTQQSSTNSNDKWFIPIWFATKYAETVGPFWLTPTEPLNLGFIEEFADDNVVWDPEGVGYYHVVVEEISDT